MTRLAIALALGTLLGCSGSGKKDTNTGSGGGEPILAKKLSLSWGISQQGEMADLYLQMTDETGKQVSHELGRWKGACAPSTPQTNMNALIALQCKTGGTGTELQVLVRGGAELIIVKLGIDEGTMPDPMAREEVKRIRVTLGAKIEAGS